MRISRAATLKETLPQDALASVVVFLVALPLCMGIAIASGVPPAAGLITGIIGGIVAGSLAGCPLQVSGPAAGLAVIVYELVSKHGFEMLAPVIVAAGLLQAAAGAFRAGQLFRAISPAVIYGMLAGIGILIFSAQFHVMVDDKPRENGILNLISVPQAIAKGVWPLDGSTHHLAALLGIVTIGALILWNKFAPRGLKSVPGALVAVVLATAIAQVAGLNVRYVDLPANLFSAIQLPTAGAFARLADTEFLVAAVAFAFVASAETLLSAAAVDQMHDGPRTKYNRELISQGVGNTLCGLLGGLPMTGVIVRSATNVAAGAQTRLSTMLHGTWMLVLVAAAPGLLRIVPVASLAAVLVYTGYKLVNPQNVRHLLRYGPGPVGTYIVTVVMIVATNLLIGIITGLVLSFLLVVYSLSRMDIEVEGRSRHGSMDVYVKGAATFLRLPQLVDALEKLPPDREVRVDARQLHYIDESCIDALSNWEQKRNGKLARTTVEWPDLLDRSRTRGRVLEPSPETADAASHGGTRIAS